MSSNIRNKRAVLLTATIIPNSIYTHHADPKERLAEYMRAIRFYCDVFNDDDVWFLENSEYDLENDQDFCELRSQKRFSVMRFPKDIHFLEGKGYQEFRMLDEAVEKLSAEYGLFIKVTGRYIVRNAFSLTDSVCSGIFIDLYRNEMKADTFFLYFNPEFYLSHFKGAYAEVNDNTGNFIEKVLYKRIMDRKLLDLCRPFRRTSRLEGRTGSYGIVLKRKPLNVLFRDVYRVFCNIFGIKTFFK